MPAVLGACFLTVSAGSDRFIRLFETVDCMISKNRPGKVASLRRPVPHDRLGTRDRLLDAAEDLFSARGYRATSVRDITSRGECNLAAVNYHFGGKQNLYREMFHRRLRALRDRRIASIHRVLEEAGRRATPEIVLHAFTTAFLEPHLEESRGRLLMRLIAREAADPHLSPGTFRKEMMGPVQEELARALRAVCPGLKDGASRRCIHSIVAQLVQVVQVRHVPAPVGCKEAGDFDLSRVIDHIVRFSAAGIRACCE